MADSEKRGNVSKVYCEKCDIVFDSRSEFDKHFERHSGVVCESCPIDTAISKIFGFFKKNN